jgi:EmrB/QacA subfamily drug resistance transporter
MSATPTSPSGGAPAADDALTRDVWLVASVVVLGAVMSILDTTVALATVIPLTGWGAERFGTKRLYMTSITLFVLGSVLSGLAWSDGSLIVFRVLQGFGGGMIMPAGMTILTRAAGPNRVGRVMAVIGVPMMLGPIFGPVLGGWLVDSASWRWIFFINVPIGAIALFMSLRILPKDVAQPSHKLDVLGVLLLSPSLAAIIYGLAKSGQNGGFGHAVVIIPIVAGVLVFCTWVWHSLRDPDTALVDLRLFKNKTFSASLGVSALMIIAVFGGMLLVPLYFQAVRGETALQTGLLLIPQGVGAMLSMPIAGSLVDKTGTGRIVPVGLFIVGLSFLGLTQLGGDTSYWLIGGLLFIQGLGMGAAMMPAFSGAMQTLRRRQIARASTTLNINQQVGASIGTAILSVLLATALSDKLGGGGGGIGGAANLSEAARARIAQPMAEAFGQTFWWALAFVAIAFVVAVIALPKHKPEPVDDPDDEGEPVDAAALAMVG